jgi:type II secretory pathway pseudopilin PulG
MKNKFKTRSGFTLVELLIAVSLFIVVVTISMGAILSIFDANKKAQSSKTVVDNLNLSIENMARIIRFGSSYHCGNFGTLSNPNDCAVGDTFIAVNFNGSTIIYRWNGTTSDAVQRSDNGGVTYTDITAPEAKIEYVKFYVFGTASGDTNQPYVVAVIKGHVGSKTTTQTVFSVETLMSQRTLDI